ncbi:hypothetical protein K470DRAFT_264837 [Piedraia hortae CBS 480.64]|uniref:Transcription activator GCR1-like domain-containing protein n=1 Tax=Piedraia hortae CBS 480.64 TaxID=1314780 RepID=A0A6A7BXR8_9PEZI|nr:hypothetical protein K470DRAFT_264837 [Piedraia hortae CBS 480.64]
MDPSAPSSPSLSGGLSEQQFQQLTRGIELKLENIQTEIMGAIDRMRQDSLRQSIESRKQLQRMQQEIDELSQFERNRQFTVTTTVGLDGNRNGDTADQRAGRETRVRLSSDGQGYRRDGGLLREEGEPSAEVAAEQVGTRLVNGWHNMGNRTEWSAQPEDASAHNTLQEALLSEHDRATPGQPAAVAANSPAQHAQDRSIATVPDLWQEWTVGLNGNPSVQSLEASLGASWRNKESDRSYYFRRKRIIDEIIRRASKGPAGSILEEVNGLEKFRADNKFSLNKLGDWIAKNKT